MPEDVEVPTSASSSADPASSPRPPVKAEASPEESRAKLQEQLRNAEDALKKERLARVRAENEATSAETRRAKAEREASQLREQLCGAGGASSSSSSDAAAAAAALATTIQLRAELEQTRADVAKLARSAAAAAATAVEQAISQTQQREAATQAAEKLNVDSLESQVLRAQLGEELKAKSSELHQAQLKNASSDERVGALQWLEPKTEQQAARMEVERAIDVAPDCARLDVRHPPKRCVRLRAACCCRLRADARQRLLLTHDDLRML